jgi:AcrR family transcriptional regulator
MMGIGTSVAVGGAKLMPIGRVKLARGTSRRGEEQLEPCFMTDQSVINIMIQEQPKPRRTRRKDARPAEILSVALDLFAERGFAATKLEDIAEAAGIGKGTIYLYFATKEDLFKAAVRQELLPNLDHIETLMATYEGSSAEIIRWIIHRQIGLLDSNLIAIPKLIVTEAGNFPTIARFYADEVIKRAIPLLTRIIERGIARGEFRPLEPTSVIPLLGAPFLMMVLWKHSLGRHTDMTIDPKAVLETHLDILLRGLAAEAPR